MTLSLHDSELNQAILSNSNPAEDQYLLVVNALTAAIHTRASDRDAWKAIAQGDLGENTAKTLQQALDENRTFLLEVTLSDPGSMDIPAAISKKIDAAGLKAWTDNVEALSSGRGEDLDKKDKHAVGCAAGWHCQFDGCGEDLRAHTLPWIKGNFAYFAHIIASSPKGPRGDPVESPKRAKDPENILLLCDKCHRLIDRVAPQDYPADRLFEMRRNNHREVARLLETLKFEDAEMIVVANPIEGQVVSFNERAAEEAMWLSKLRRGKREPLYLMQNGNLSASSDKGYWYGMFKGMEQDLPVLQRRVRGTDGNNGKPPRIALFPLHSTSVLIATGRVLGEASSITQFQFHRNQVGSAGAGQWAWFDPNPPLESKYKIIVRKPYEPNAKEALFRVFLTDPVPDDQLPIDFYSQGQFRTPTIDVTIESTANDSIGHPDDLVLLGKALDKAYRLLQDEWQVKKINLLVIAPATACVRVGQKMQARNQADFVLWERKPGMGQPFQPTITITSTHIHHDSGESVKIS